MKKEPKEKFRTKKNQQPKNKKVQWVGSLEGARDRGGGQ